MRVYKESKTGRWFVDYFFLGNRYRYKAGNSKRVAEVLCHRIQTEINTGAHNPISLRAEVRGEKRPGSTFGDLVERFLKSYKSRGQTGYYQGKAKTWLVYFGKETPISEIGSYQVEQFRNRRLLDVSQSTAKKDLISLGTFFRWGIRRGFLKENPADPLMVKRPSEPPGREIFLSDEEVERVKDCSPKDIRRLVSWLSESGMRLGEALQLCWGDLDSNTGWIYVAPGKTGKSRRIPFTDALRGITRGIPRQIRGRLVFCGTEGQPLIAYWASKQVKAAMVRANIPKASAHTLRHTFASRLARRGVPMMAIADLLGQNVATTTARYMHLDPEYLKKAIAVLEEPGENLHGSNVAETNN